MRTRKPVGHVRPSKRAVPYARWTAPSQSAVARRRGQLTFLPESLSRKFESHFTCPKEFVPGRPGGFIGDVIAKQGCCVLEAALGVAESLYLLYECQFSFGLGKVGHRLRRQNAAWFKEVCKVLSPTPRISTVAHKCCSTPGTCFSSLGTFMNGNEKMQEQFVEGSRIMFNTCMDLKRATVEAKIGKSGQRRSAGVAVHEAQIAMQSCHNAEKMLLTVVHFLAESAGKLYSASTDPTDLTAPANSILRTMASPHSLKYFMKQHKGMQFDVVDEESSNRNHDEKSMMASHMLQRVVGGRVQARVKKTAALHQACAVNRYAQNGCEVFWGPFNQWKGRDWDVYCNWHSSECEKFGKFRRRTHK